jgi:hypothetical protein
MSAAGMAWIPDAIMDWGVLSLLEHVAKQTSFADDHIKKRFTKKRQAVRTAIRGDEKISNLLLRLGSDCEMGETKAITLKLAEACIQQFIQEVFKHCRTDVKENAEERILDGSMGLSHEILGQVYKKRIKIARAVGKTAEEHWFQHLQRLFDWEDGHLRAWEKKLYRTQVQRCFKIIAGKLGERHSTSWRKGLGRLAAKHVWIIPRFSDASFHLSSTYKAAGGGSERLKGWISGVHGSLHSGMQTLDSWNPSTRLEWSWGAEEFMTGYPTSLQAHRQGGFQVVIPKGTWNGSINRG